MKKVLSIMLVAFMLFGILSLAASAKEINLLMSGAIISGTTGDATYSLDDRGSGSGYQLSVTGKNASTNTGTYNTSVSDAPWMTYNDRITKINIEKVGRIKHGFYACPDSFSGRDASLSDKGLSVSFDSYIGTIESYAFANAHITDLRFEPLSYHSGFIDKYAFMNNDFTSVDIEWFGRVESYAFYNCKNLTSVKFESAGTKVFDNAFAGCSNISYVYWPGTPAEFKKAVSATGNSSLLNAKTIEYGTKTPIEITAPVYLTVTEPEIGMTPDFKVTLAPNDYCELATDVNDPLTVFNQTDLCQMNEYLKFEIGKIYSFNVRLQGKVGKDSDGNACQYIFTEKTPLYINNRYAKLGSRYSDNAIANVYYDFAAKEGTYHTVSFDPNGGSGVMAPVKVKNGELCEYPECTFTPPEGKEFAGWNCGNSGYIFSDTVVKALWKTTVTGYVDLVHAEFKWPEPGEHPDFIVSQDNPNVKFDETVDPLFCPHGKGIEYYDLEEKRYLEPDDVFVEGRKYKITVIFFTVSEDIHFADDLVVYFNEVEATATAISGFSAGLYEYTCVDLPEPPESDTDTSDTDTPTDTESDILIIDETDTENQTDTEAPDDTDKPTDTDSGIMGDVTGDGNVTMEDVVMLQKYIAKLIEFTPEQIKLGDVDRSGEITMLDVTTMQKFIAKLIEKF